jgi:S-methylmethionine-dependent homocysteine/selenocysteine methylase
LRSGQRVEDAVAAAARLGASAVLFNCSQPEVMGAAIGVAVEWAAKRAESEPNLQIGVYANAFAALREKAEANAELHEMRADITPDGYLAWVSEWIEQGARIVGGCCGIGPEHIGAIRSMIDARARAARPITG